ncbi:hypothetical protein AWH62_12750 [Maricaulis sp. W15]|uniref:CHAT domain-containing protein n=1 Tax=Maricaulis sp. W15 TaxID=1772333 RepID=UPI0009488B94|nr:CHAT domain-containing protein [Maricaulis sp. W15]OLF71409.1 hypothetical protein AWH62_12750 [Maricaulis sp. W15]
MTTAPPSASDLARQLDRPNMLWRTLEEEAEALRHQLAAGDWTFEPGWFHEKEGLARSAIEKLTEARTLVSAQYDPAKFAQTSEHMARTYKLIARLSVLDDVGASDSARLFQPESDHLSDRSVAYLENAINCFGECLAAHKDYSYRRTQEGLLSEIGEELVQLRDWERAAASFKAAAEIGQLIQFDVAVSRDELADLIRWFESFTECAGYSFIRCDRKMDALGYLDAAKARLLIKFFGINTIELSQRDRKTLEALRLEQAELEKALTPQVVKDRRAKVERVMSIRGELEGIAGKLAAPPPETIQEKLVELLDDEAILAAPVLSSFGGETVFAYLQAGNVEVGSSRSVDALYFKQAVQEDSQSWIRRYAKYKASRGKRGLEQGKALTEAIRSASAALGDLFVDALDDALKERGLASRSKMLIVPHGALARLPIASAKLSDGTQLIDRYELIYLPSVSVGASVSKIKPSAHSSALAIANVAGETADGQNMPHFNDAECALVCAFCSGEAQWLTRDHAADGVRAVLGGLAGSQVWHFTAHGRFNELDPAQSHLDITPSEKITLGELYKAGHQTRPDLVVLSACETGLYDCEDIPNELIGWPAAFLELGAKGVIATQWPVASLPTAFLMAKLYEEMWGETGATVSAALRAAQMWIKDVPAADLPPIVERWVEAGQLDRNSADDLLNGLAISGCAADGQAFPEPIYWAGFVYYGDPGLRLRR